MSDLVKKIHSAIQQNKLTLLCGAGLSAPPPSLLPLAVKLVDQVLDSALGEFKRFVPEASLRPEVIFNIISRHAGDVLLGILRAILSERSYNRGHDFAATCLQRDCHVVTTNFDCLIEEASAARGISIARVVSGDHRRVVTNPVLLKIHGSIDAPESLMVTINDVFRGLSSDMELLFGSLLAGRLVLVVGYSGLDQLDIMPVLAASEPELIVWFSHSNEIAGWVESQPEDGLIAQLPALSYYTGDTNALLANLQPVATFGSGGAPEDLRVDVGRLSRRVKERVVVDLLMHQNRYEEVVELIKRERLGRYLEFRIARLEALGSIGEKSRRYLRLRQGLMKSLLASPGNEFVASLAKFARGARERESVFQRICGLSDEERRAPEVIEAGLELAYEFGLDDQFDRASDLLDGSCSAARLIGDIILVARSKIIRSSILIQRYHQEASEVLIEPIISEASEAMSLLDESIVNDMYFYCQARNNRATGLRFRGEYLQALEDYRRNLAYFRQISVNHTIHTLYNMSVAFVAMGSVEKAREALREALLLNKQGKRTYLLEKIELLLAEIDSESDNPG